MPRHALAFRYFKLNRDGISDAPLNLIINDIVIPIETPVSSEFTNAVHAFKYRFAFVNNDNLRFSGGLGLNIQDIEATIVADDVDVGERGEVTAPLPTLDLSLAWAITPQWILTGDVGWFELTIDDIKGQIAEFRVGITWKPFRNVGFNLAYNSFEADGDVKEEEGNFRGMLEYKFQGPMLGIVATF